MFTRIKAPKYKIGRYSLNEYELRCLMLEVAQGKKPSGFKVKDEKGHLVTITKDGRLSENIYGFDINSNYTIGVLRLNKAKPQI